MLDYPGVELHEPLLVQADQSPFYVAVDHPLLCDPNVTLNLQGSQVRMGRRR
jgi:hypothetical protein